MLFKIILLFLFLIFTIVFHSGSFTTKVVISIIAFGVFVHYLSREIFFLLKTKGDSIRFSKWELRAKERYSYKTIISLYIFAILMLGSTIVIGLRSLDIYLINGKLTDNEAFVATLGLVAGLMGIIALIQASYIKYILYIKKSKQIQRDSDKNGSD